jgi:hypothetical protein
MIEHGEDLFGTVQRPKRRASFSTSQWSDPVCDLAIAHVVGEQVARRVREDMKQIRAKNKPRRDARTRKQWLRDEQLRRMMIAEQEQEAREQERRDRTDARERVSELRNFD